MEYVIIMSIRKWPTSSGHFTNKLPKPGIREMWATFEIEETNNGKYFKYRIH